MNVRLICRFIALVVVSSSAVSAMKQASATDVFPGNSDSKPLTVHIAVPLVGSAVKSYFKATGSWPESWQAVEDALLFQNTLLAPGGQAIDPDDGSLDFDGDVVYTPGSGASLPLLSWVQKLPSGGQDVRSYKLEPPQTYKAYCEGIAAKGDSESWSQAALRNDMHVMFALASTINRSVDLFHIIKGRMPLDWDELVSSGLAPVTAQSISPISRELLTGDRKPYQFVYQRYGDDGYSLEVCDASGRSPWICNF